MCVRDRRVSLHHSVPCIFPLNLELHQYNSDICCLHCGSSGHSKVILRDDSVHPPSAATSTHPPHVQST